MSATIALRVRDNAGISTAISPTRTKRTEDGRWSVCASERSRDGGNFSIRRGNGLLWLREHGSTVLPKPGLELRKHGVAMVAKYTDLIGNASPAMNAFVAFCSGHKMLLKDKGAALACIVCLRMSSCCFNSALHC